MRPSAWNHRANASRQSRPAATMPKVSAVERRPRRYSGGAGRAKARVVAPSTVARAPVPIVLQFQTTKTSAATPMMRAPSPRMTFWAESRPRPPDGAPPGIGGGGPCGAGESSMAGASDGRGRSEGRAAPAPTDDSRRSRSRTRGRSARRAPRRRSSETSSASIHHRRCAVGPTRESAQCGQAWAEGTRAIRQSGHG